MLDAQFLKIITVLYVEDDLEVQDSSGIIFKQIFNKVIIVNNGKEALDTYEKSLMSDNPIDIIISDIMMPTMDGIELLNHIRKINPDIPYIFTTGHTNNEYLLESIKNNVSDYLVKPVNIKELVQKAQNVCKLIYEHKLVLHNQKEATEYLSIINKVAIVSKTDTKGNITFVNDIFCETSGYLEEELLGKPHNIIRHPEMPKSTFENLWSTVKSGKEWTGKVKNMSKNGESYHVNATIFPLYNEIDTKIVGFMAIRFLITDEESQKREFKTQVRGMITKYKCDIKKLEESNKEYEIQIKHSDFGFLESRVKKEIDKSNKLSTQVNYCENIIKEQELKIKEEQKSSNSKLLELQDNNKSLAEQIIKLEKELELNKEDIKDLGNKLANKSEENAKLIKNVKDLRDVITHQDKKLTL